MRYLGKVYAAMDSLPEASDKMNVHQLQMMGDYKHVKNLIEREIFLRCAKHVVNKIIQKERGETDLNLALIVAHCLNCLLAPQPFI